MLRNPLFGLSAALALVAGICLTAAPAAAAEIPEVGVEWINKCSPCGNHDLSGRDDVAVKFYDKIAHHGGIGRFRWGNAAAWEQDFKHKNAGGTDYYWVDTVDIVMHADHGGPGVFCFGEKKHDRCYFWCGDARWGDQDLEWIILDDCSCLYDGDNKAFQRWGAAFQGLHQILAFYSNAHDNYSRGELFANKLLAGWRVRTAWRYACEHTEGGTTKGAVMGAGKGGVSSMNDHLWGRGWVSPDFPPQPGRFLWLWTFPCD